MRILITGLNGTLAPKLAQAVREAGHTVLGWDRAHASPDDANATAAHLATLAPDAIAHLAMGPASWAGALAAHAAQHRLPFVFTSTAMVFDHEPDGPHRPGDTRTASDDYGRYKIACEDAVLAANPQACIARIGWQIDPDARGNNMLAALDQRQAEQGRIEASRWWRPACSFMSDTVEVLFALLNRPVAGVVHLDSNAEDGWTFDVLAECLRRRYGRQDWKVIATDGYRHDQRLFDAQRRMPDLSARI